MDLFGSRLPDGPSPGGVPVRPVDLSARYDVYSHLVGEDRVYEDVRFVGVRTFERVNEFSSGLAGGFLEVEAADGGRWLIPSFGIQLVCEHGTRPAYRVLRRWADGR